MHTNIHDAMRECGPGHPAHVQKHIAIGRKSGRIVAIRTGNKPDTFNLSFSDPKADLRQGGDTIYDVPEAKVTVIIENFLEGYRVSTNLPWTCMMINQAHRDVTVVKITPTRCRIEYELPNSGEVGAWRHQTSIGKYIYIAEWY